MKWIKIKEQMPKEDVKVLVIYCLGTDGPEICSASWSKACGWYNYDLALPSPINITYWIEFPKTPEIWY